MTCPSPVPAKIRPRSSQGRRKQTLELKPRWISSGVGAFAVVRFATERLVAWSTSASRPSSSWAAATMLPAPPVGDAESPVPPAASAEASVPPPGAAPASAEDGEPRGCVEPSCPPAAGGAPVAVGEAVALAVTEPCPRAAAGLAERPPLSPPEDPRGLDGLAPSPPLRERGLALALASVAPPPDSVLALGRSGSASPSPASRLAARATGRATGSSTFLPL